MSPHITYFSYIEPFLSPYHCSTTEHLKLIIGVEILHRKYTITAKETYEYDSEKRTR